MALYGKAGNTASPSVFSVIEMGSLLQLYALTTFTGLNFRISLQQQQISAADGPSDR